jgi:2,3-bisphosphoglycerate-dependent phosphoglycerate mutase
MVRLLPYWQDSIVKDLKVFGTVLVVAHGNSLRALVKHLDDVSDAEIVGLNIPTGIPLWYELDKDMCPMKRSGTYLDPVAAEAAIAKVAKQGR